MAMTIVFVVQWTLCFLSLSPVSQLIMLSVYASSGSIVDESRIKKYFEYIKRDKSKMAMKYAAIVYKNGTIAEQTNKFKLAKGNLQVSSNTLS